MEPPMNPIQKNIAAGMSPLVAFLTQSTCGEACWTAREETCRCSCGGKNHGCLKTGNEVRPTRTAKIDGFRYELKAVGHGLHDEAKKINDAAPMRHIGGYTYFWSETEKGAPARLRSATADQCNKWEELSAYKCEPWPEWSEKQRAAGNAVAYINYPLFSKPYLLWVRVD